MVLGLCVDVVTNQYIAKNGVAWDFLTAVHSNDELVNVCHKQGVQYDAHNRFVCIEKRRYQRSHGGRGIYCPYQLRLQLSDGVKISKGEVISDKFDGTFYYFGKHCHSLENTFSA